MSWDVVLIKTKTNSETITEIDEANILIFDIENVIAMLKEMFFAVSHVDDQWLHYENGLYAISFNLASDKQIMLHVNVLDEPEDAVEAVIHDLCKMFRCRAFDTTSGEFL